MRLLIVTPNPRLFVVARPRIDLRTWYEVRPRDPRVLVDRLAVCLSILPRHLRSVPTPTHNRSEG